MWFENSTLNPVLFGKLDVSSRGLPQKANNRINQDFDQCKLI